MSPAPLLASGHELDVKITEIVHSMMQSLPEKEINRSSVQPTGRETLDGKDYKYLVNKVENFESHLCELSIKVGQLKLDRIS